MDMQHSVNYDIDLSGEPSGISAYMVLPADTTQESQNLGLMVERLCLDCGIQARVRQYYGGNRDDFYDLLDWTSLNVSEDNALTISVDKAAVQAGGKTILELKMTSSNSLPFVSGAKVVLTNPWTIQTLLVPQNHVATICDGGDDYRFGFNGQEKVNEIAGLGNHYEFKYRNYSPLTGKFWSVDPLALNYPWNSTYAFAENDVIRCIDLEGLEKYIIELPKGLNGMAWIRVNTDVNRDNNFLFKYGGENKFYKDWNNGYERKAETDLLQNQQNDNNGSRTVGLSFSYKMVSPFASLSSKNLTRSIDKELSWLSDRLINDPNLIVTLKSDIGGPSSRGGPFKSNEKVNVDGRTATPKELSLLRSRYLKSMLVERYGVDASQVQVQEGDYRNDNNSQTQFNFQEKPKEDVKPEGKMQQNEN